MFEIETLGPCLAHKLEWEMGGGDVPPWPLPPVATPLVHPMSWIVWSYVCLYNTILSPQNTHVYAILTQIVPKYRNCKICFMFVLMKTLDNISIARTFVLWRKLLPCLFSPHLKGPPPHELTYFWEWQVCK